MIYYTKIAFIISHLIISVDPLADWDGYVELQGVHCAATTVTGDLGELSSMARDSDVALMLIF